MEMLDAAKNWVEKSFEIRERRSCISTEIFCGCLHFISCLFILPVIPIQLEAADYDRSKSIQITALATAVGCIISSYITNLPFVIAPPSVVSIYIAVALQKSQINQSQADSAVVLSGFALLFIGIFKPIISFATKLIPDCIQASTAIGIGLITALAGAIELRLVVPGEYSILEMGEITPAILIAILSTVIIGIFQFYRIKGSYFFGLLFGTLSWWTYMSDWPTTIFAVPKFAVNENLLVDRKVVNLLISLIFLYILTLNGIARTMSDLANLTNLDGSIPRGNWLFITCGLTTILSGYFSGPAILISPETAAGIKGGAKTGLSTLVCGLLFSVSVFLCPVFERIPPSGTSPLLILVGLTLFVNTSLIDWSTTDEAIPAFFVLFLIPFTYSILTGVGVGYTLYILIGLFTGQLQRKIRKMMHPYSSLTAIYKSLSSNRDKSYISWESLHECSVDSRDGTVLRVTALPNSDARSRSTSCQSPLRVTQEQEDEELQQEQQCLTPVNHRLFHNIISMDLQMNSIKSIRM